jgi:hypothetical protein
MTSNPASAKIWIDPPRYYAATAGMTPNKSMGYFTRLL